MQPPPPPLLTSFLTSPPSSFRCFAPIASIKTNSPIKTNISFFCLFLLLFLVSFRQNPSGLRTPRGQNPNQDFCSKTKPRHDPEFCLSSELPFGISATGFSGRSAEFIAFLLCFFSLFFPRKIKYLYRFFFSRREDVGYKEAQDGLGAPFPCSRARIAASALPFLNLFTVKPGQNQRTR